MFGLRPNLLFLVILLQLIPDLTILFESTSLFFGFNPLLLIFSLPHQLPLAHLLFGG